MYVFQDLGHMPQRCPDMFPEVMLQEGQAEVPLGSTHCLHGLRVAHPGCSLQTLIQSAYFLQPGLWEDSYRLQVSPVAVTAL